MDIPRAALIGLLAGVLGTGTGGLLSLFFGLESQARLSFLLAASGGVMISISLVELIPEAIEVGSKGWAAAGFLLGTVVLFLLDSILPHAHSARVPAHRGRLYHRERITKFRSVGLLIGLGIAMHNIPEGLAIGATYTHQESLGLGVALIIAVQNIPEGMAMALPLKAGKVRSKNIVLLTIAAGVPMGAGAFAGAVLGTISPIFLSISLGFAAGAMMYVVSDELIPEAHFSSSEHHPTVGLVIGVLVGVVVTFLL